MALGAVLGSPHALTAAAVFAAGWASRAGRPVPAGVLAGLAAALDPLALAAVPFLVSSWEASHRRRAGMAAGGAFGVSILPSFLLDPGAFFGAVVRGPEAGPGLGIANLALYAGFTSYGVVAALVLAALAALALAKPLATSRPASPLALAALATLLVLVAVPGASADAIAVPLALCVLAVLPLRTLDGSTAPP